MSRCSRCEEIQPAEAFYKGRNKNGLHPWCKECCKASSRKFSTEYRQVAHEMSKSWDTDYPGMCQAVLNMGRWTARMAARCSARAVASGYCLRHATPEQRARAVTLRGILEGSKPYGSEAFRARQADERIALMEVFRADPEAAELLEAQHRDIQRGHWAGAKWQLSLDAYAYDDVPWYEVVGFGSRFLKACVSDAWVDVVIAKVDRAREIDAWAEDRAAA